MGLVHQYELLMAWERTTRCMGRFDDCSDGLLEMDRQSQRKDLRWREMLLVDTEHDEVVRRIWNRASTAQQKKNR